MSTTPAAESNVDVLVIGAGPAGLMAAHALAKFGVNVRIIDQRPAKVAAGQADGIQPRTVEVFQSYGLAERLLREGNQLHTAAFYNPNSSGGIECTGRARDVSADTARYPYEVTLHQGAIENIFLDSMATIGAKVERPVTPISMHISENSSELADPTKSPVRVVLKHLDAPEGQDTEIVNAKFVIGADGAHSWVRKTLNITLDGEQTNYIWGVIDILPTTDFPDVRNRCAIHSNNGSLMIIPREGDLIRLYIQLTDTDVVDPNTGRVDKDRMGPEELLQVAKKSFHPYTMDTDAFDWWTIYVIGQRVASKFSVHDRVFIAGDACHTHSPKAGQGMNASMNDTHNLAWKLAHVLRGWTDISLLKTYEFERRKYAQDLIDFDKKFSALFSGKPHTEENQDGVSHHQFLEAFQTFGLFTSGIGVHYAPSTIVNTTHQSYASNLIIGQRVLPHVFVRVADGRPFEIQDLLPSDARFKILVFAGDITQESQVARVKECAAHFDKPEGFFRKYGGKNPEKVFDVLAICSQQKDTLSYTDLPEVFRAHWSKVLTDDQDMFKRTGGDGYKTYGIDLLQGVVAVVRPDGYVSMLAPLDGVQDIDQYFSGFMRA
ncbi:FAD binding domain-containing protein [Irpex rosettiformis]|uniref:FAD binding domain-containing protein n=1 Tax=Irpex rosettiformis TaxID=378272 RepID=A0ACB8UBE3_9APHY|nr:FAD binding domain-containing protein [Irpex rosettiformis]